MNHSKCILGVEGGGTKTDWVLLDEKGAILKEGQLRASNLKLSTDAQLSQIFSVLPEEATHVGVFLAGCLIDADRLRLRRLVEQRWPNAHCVVGSDRDSGFATALGKKDGILVISGTGAVVQGRRGEQMEKAGGWGHILGDRGGGYDMARQALRKVILRYDLEKTITPLASAILANLGLNELPHLVDWANQADKMQVARLVPVIFRAAESGDTDMQDLLRNRASDLADFTFAVARRLQMLSGPVEVRLIGGLLTREPLYARLYEDFVHRKLPEARVALCIRSGAFGAADLAAEENGEAAARAAAIREAEVESASTLDQELSAAATEQVHSRAKFLDSMPVLELVDLFVEEEHIVQRALAACRDSLAQAIEEVVAKLKIGGRLFYVGAGTSGRLGVLDASEMPPTFGTPPQMVQGIIAGGQTALMNAVEAAEDAAEAGALAIMHRCVESKDVVLGIAASGRTPFVLGALEQARRFGARTILLTCNPSRKPSKQPWDVEIDLPTGPEIVTGSTRLKAGTATKVALNTISTCSMIRLGNVVGGTMINLRPTNAKLRGRAIRIVKTALEIDDEAARDRLERAHWNIKAALAG